MGLSRWIL